MADPVGAAVASWQAGAVAWLQRNGAVIAGLLVGMAARYGLTINEGRRLTWRGMLADFLLLGLLGLIAIAIADALNLVGNNRVLVGALAAVSSDRLARLVRDRFLQQVRAQLAAPAIAAPGAALIPAGVGEPGEIRVQPATPDHPTARAGVALKTAFRRSTALPSTADHAELIRQLRDD